MKESLHCNRRIPASGISRFVIHQEITIIAGAYASRHSPLTMHPQRLPNIHVCLHLKT